ncbi:hypothetical protein [Sphingomonas sp. BK580]|nr:hypothetical protein [Sphingomonas sp. BK580]MBB3692303.1 hypothetical protein [Sphingomonas sp. BK580]
MDDHRQPEPNDLDEPPAGSDRAPAPAVPVERTPDVQESEAHPS